MTLQQINLLGLSQKMETHKPKMNLKKYDGERYTN
jgi:hypothetical protein